MWKRLRAAAAFIERRTDELGTGAAFIGLAMIGLVTINVVLRYTMSVGAVWAQELEWHLLAALILLGMAHALLRGGEVRVDLVYQHYSPAGKRVVDVIATLLMIAVSVVLILLSLGYVEQARSIGEASPDPGGLPYRWLIKSLIPLGFTLVTLQQLALLVRLLDPQRTPPAALADVPAKEGGHA